jgi:hypothetical protein
MAPSPVVIIAETPSLAASIRDLLDAERIPTRLFVDPAAAARACERRGARAVVVACNAADCATIRLRRAGRFPRTRLIVVGARDPELRREPNVWLLPLPLDREALVSLLRNLVSAPAAVPG